MDKEILNLRFNQLLNYLPPSLQGPLLRLDPEIKSVAQEIRLRAGSPLSITVSGSQFFINKNGTCMLPKSDCLKVKSEEIDECFLKLCNHSVYSHNEELCEGYIMLEGGHRAGICGRVYLKNGRIETVRDISSINLRIAKEVCGCADKIINSFDSGGILICGGPGTGKTTLLRDIARQLAGGATGKCLKVAIIDSRGEIAAVSGGVPMVKLGNTCDILTACPKGKGIEIALRTLFPDIIIFDELGDMEEVNAVKQSFNSGVTVITSAHAGDINDLKKRSQINSLLESGAITKIVMCSGKNNFDYDILPLPLITENNKKLVTV